MKYYFTFFKIFFWSLLFITWRNLLNIIVNNVYESYHITSNSLRLSEFVKITMRSGTFCTRVTSAGLCIRIGVCVCVCNVCVP